MAVTEGKQPCPAQSINFTCELMLARSVSCHSKCIVSDNIVGQKVKLAAQCVSRHVAAALVLGPAEAAHHRVESLATPGSVYERRDGTWTSFPNLRRIFIVNIRKCSE